MKRKINQGLLTTRLKSLQIKWGLLKRIRQGLCLLLCAWLLFNVITLISASSKSTSAFFVMGGSIQREVHVAQLAKQYPDIPILISKGSQDPCIVNIFQEKGVNLQNTWLERCANSTFENFYYSLPILQSWGVHKVKLITSPTHLPRALWMGQIILGAHGIWVEPEIVKERGIPGNYESWFKTGLDLGRSFVWAGLSYFIQPKCSDVGSLADVDMTVWQRQKFRCEYRPKG
ncbi:YdcF family protein [Calothrix sp. PCC 6303]|uniref:YdcF family protein n=1 Tax=Calothrix sp. PCC 6303 TaxID=1170562 RepID=UPI0002A02B29|nr:YdcF family protein [Calothrix sp. PCC 6303]AFZ00332.1 protein of unknown function DUF218 [Calothrix sp. PCC 6303]